MAINREDFGISSQPAVDIMGTFSRASGATPQKSSTLSTVLSNQGQKATSQISNTDSLKASKTAAPGDNAASGLKAAAQQEIGAMKAGWNEARKDAVAEAKSVGPGIAGQGITAAGIDKSYGASTASTVVDAIGHVAVEAAMAGAGTFAKATLGGATSAPAVASNGKELSSSQRAKLEVKLADQPKQSASQAEVARMSGAQAPVSKSTEGLNAKGYGELLAGRIEDQKEFKQAQIAVDALDGVENHDKTVQERTDLADAGEKLEAAIERGSTIELAAIEKNEDLFPVSALALDHMALKPTAVHLSVSGFDSFESNLGGLDATVKEAIAGRVGDAPDLPVLDQEAAAAALSQNAAPVVAQVSA